MNPILKNVLAYIAGLLLGNMVNFGAIQLGNMILPPPDGLDPMDPASIQAHMDSFEPMHFIIIFLAHALGTLLGAFIAARLAATHRMKIALGIGVFFLLGGTYMITLVGGPIWFILLDLLAAYIPMAWLGGKMGIGKAKAV